MLKNYGCEIIDWEKCIKPYFSSRPSLEFLAIANTNTQQTEFKFGPFKSVNYGFVK